MRFVIPVDWRSSLGLLAATFHWSPSELMRLRWREIPKWVEQAKRYQNGRS